MTLHERTGLVTLQGEPVTLLGDPVRVGVEAPAFRAVDEACQPVRLSEFQHRVVLINAVPSLDVGVCTPETRRFHEEAVNLPDNVVSLTISMAIPFAQKRLCAFHNTERNRILSDSVWREFGSNYGLLIKGLGLLARCVLVISQDGLILHQDLLPEIVSQPDYDAALRVAQAAAAQPMGRPWEGIHAPRTGGPDVKGGSHERATGVVAGSRVAVGRHHKRR